MDRNQFNYPFNFFLNEEDSLKQTFGCRDNNPDMCANNTLPGICAFTSNDTM